MKNESLKNIDNFINGASKQQKNGKRKKSSIENREKATEISYARKKEGGLGKLNPREAYCEERWKAVTYLMIMCEWMAELGWA